MEELRLNCPLFNFDSEIRKARGGNYIAGIDEAGRGCLAGDVFAAAVVFGEEVRIPGLDDSKKLTATARDSLYDEIVAKATAYAIASASVGEIEELNILNAALLAMKRAYEMLGNEIIPELVLIDGNKAPALDAETLTVIKGDGHSASIAAASILAKVSRDRYAEELDKAYPEYRFAKHKGYGTKLHYEMIEQYGICPVHRKSFLKKILNGE